MKTLTTGELLHHIASNPQKYELGELSRILAQLPPEEAKLYATANAGMNKLREGARDLPFEPKYYDLKEIDPQESNAMRNSVSMVHARLNDEQTVAGLLERMGSDSDRPVDNSPPSLAETVEAAITLHGE